MGGKPAGSGLTRAPSGWGWNTPAISVGEQFRGQHPSDGTKASRAGLVVRLLVVVPPNAPTVQGNCRTPSPNLLPSLSGPLAHRGEPWKPCSLHQAPTAHGAVRFWCSLPTADTSSFVPLELRVTAVSSGAQRYSRIIHINEVGKLAGNGDFVGCGSLALRPPDQPVSSVLLDPPTGLLARRADEGGHVVLRWLPPPGAPVASLIRYEVNISSGNIAAGSQKVRPPLTSAPKAPRWTAPPPPSLPPRWSPRPHPRSRPSRPSL